MVRLTGESQGHTLPMKNNVEFYFQVYKPFGAPNALIDGILYRIYDS